VAVSNLLRLLELPDEALQLLEQGRLTEGHGRALLLSPDHADRRTLARRAAAEDWSVRELERRARHGAPSARRPPRRAAAELHPDRQAAIDQISDALSEALGSDVSVRPVGLGYTVQLSFASLDDALDMARRLRLRRAA
jgi:ParB family chromosome partitioning protein